MASPSQEQIRAQIDKLFPESEPDLSKSLFSR